MTGVGVFSLSLQNKHSVLLETCWGV